MIRLAWRMLARDWRSGELLLVAVALTLAATIVVGLTAFSDRLARSLVAESAHLLAADRVLTSSTPVPEHWLEQARSQGLAVARVLEFQTMLTTEETMELASIKAVDDAYPLRGSLRGEPGEAAALARLERGGLWLDPRLLPLLGREVGDRVQVGELSLQVTAVLVSEPDRGASLHGLGARGLMHWRDVAATGVLLPGSRVDYRYLLAGEEADLEAFHHWLQTRLEPGHRWLTLVDAEPRVARALERARGFLLLSGSLGVVLAAIAVAMAARRYSLRRQDAVALMKSLGARGRSLLVLHALQLLPLGLLALALGSALGMGLQALLLWLLDPELAAPAAGFGRPLGAAGVTVLTCLAAFAWPPLARLARVPPLRVLRRELGAPGGEVARLVLGFVAMAALLWWYAGEAAVTAAVVAGGLALAGASGLLGWLMLGLGRALGSGAGGAARLAWSGLVRQTGASVLQLVVFSLTLMLLLLLALARTSLIDDWQLQLPERAPNHFLLNVAPEDVAEIEAWLASEGVEGKGFYPMVRGRLVAINDQPLEQWLGGELDERTRRAVDRELNLSWSLSPPPGNEIIRGRWMAAGAEGEASIEEELAERLAVDVGDRLTLRLGGENLAATVTSLRRLDWDSMQPNFFLLLSPAMLSGHPASYLSSFYLAAEDKLLLNDLVRRHPAVTVLEVDALIAQLRHTVARVSAALELVLALTVVCGLLVLLASVRASLDQRLEESALLRSLGAPRALLRTALWLEFGGLGALAGLLGAGAAELAAWGIQTWLLELPHRLHPLAWLAGPALGAVLVGSVGYWSCRHVVRVPPMKTLQGLS